MNARDIYSKTMPFVWAKLLIGLATVLISGVVFALLMGISWLFNNDGVTGIMFIIWLCAVGVVRFILMHYAGYLVKAGHIAVITEVVTTGYVPENQVAYGKQCVLERFATSNIYFAVDKLVSGAVKQIQRGVGKVGSALGFIPGMSSVTSIAQFFVDLSLGYIDECCLGYTFYKKEQGAFKSAADGVVIYAQNWKKLLGNAAKTMATVMLALAAITLAVFIVLGLIFRLFSWSGWIAFAIAVLIALAVKFAFIDSYILVRTMVTYMEDAPTTVISYDLYGNLCGLSGKFKELWDKGQQERPAAYAEGFAQTPYPDTQYEAQYDAQYDAQVKNPVLCEQCGEENERGAKFCGRCGSPMQYVK